MCFLFGCNGFVNPYSTYCTYITLLISLDFKTKEKKTPAKYYGTSWMCIITQMWCGYGWVQAMVS